MTNKMTVIILAAIITGCSSPPPPVPVAWDKAAEPLNTRLPQWRDNNVTVPSPTVNGKWTLSVIPRHNMDASSILRCRPLNTNCRLCTIRY